MNTKTRKKVEYYAIVAGSVFAALVMGFTVSRTAPILYDKKELVFPTASTKSQAVTGIYTRPVEYLSPDGLDQMEVKVEIEAGTIIGVYNIYMGDNPTAERYVDLFNKLVVDQVVGKSIESDFSATFVSGATLTNDAFVKALNEIKLELSLS